MVARIFLSLALLQVGLMYLPSPFWWLWLLHYAALEASLLATLLGLVALLTSSELPVRVLAMLAMAGGALPLILVMPLYFQQKVPFSLLQWLTVRVPAEVQIERDLPLVPGLKADLYRAPGPQPHPFVLVVHGGSWRQGDKGELPHVSKALAQSGFTVLDVQYRLSGTAPFPAAIADVKAWLVAARQHAQELGIDPERGAILGRSAGGNIALLAAYADQTLPSALPGMPATVRAVISLYGPTDLQRAHVDPIRPDVVKGPEAIEQFLGGTPEQQPEHYRQANPLTWVPNRTLPPTLLIHGQAERCVRARDSEDLATLLRQGQYVELLLIPLADHGFDVRPGGLGEQLTRGVVVRFLRSKLEGRDRSGQGSGQ